MTVYSCAECGVMTQSITEFVQACKHAYRDLVDHYGSEDGRP